MGGVWEVRFKNLDNLLSDKGLFEMISNVLMERYEYDISRWSECLAHLFFVDT